MLSIRMEIKSWCYIVQGVEKYCPKDWDSMMGGSTRLYDWDTRRTEHERVSWVHLITPIAYQLDDLTDLVDALASSVADVPVGLHSWPSLPYPTIWFGTERWCGLRVGDGKYTCERETNQYIFRQIYYVYVPYRVRWKPSYRCTADSSRFLSHPPTTPPCVYVIFIFVTFGCFYFFLFFLIFIFRLKK